jgi:hypothetical protein
MSETKSPDALSQRFMGMCELWNKDPSPFFVAMYREALLKELSFEDACKALEIPFRRKFFGFPQPGELIEIIKGGSGDKAVVAWGIYFDAMRRYGSYRTVEFQDGRIGRTLELMGGWVQSGEWLESEMQYRRSEFMKLYNSLPESMSEEPRTLPGLHRIANTARGFLEVEHDDVVRLGVIKDQKQIE